MKRSTFLNSVAAVSVLSLLTACGDNEKTNTESESEETVAAASDEMTSPAIVSPDDKISYMIGFQMASRYSEDPILNLDKAILIQGIEDAIAGKEPLVSQQEAQLAGQELQQRSEEQQAAEGEKAKAEGDAFLETNKSKPGVVTTASGLQYEIVKKGDSDQSPTATDRVKVHYHGTLTNGTVFDSSVDRGEPISFSLNGVIPGWTEGLQLMSVGDKFRFFIPSDLGYGPRATGAIPPNSVLIFDVELLGINEE